MLESTHILDPEQVRRQIRRRAFRISRGADLGNRPRSCEAVKKRARTYKDTLELRRTIEDAETKEAAMDILRAVKSRRREGKAIQLP